ncbi:unnamed protein product [Closterium sp. NIES-54]
MYSQQGFGNMPGGVGAGSGGMTGYGGGLGGAAAPGGGGGGSGGFGPGGAGAGAPGGGAAGAGGPPGVGGVGSIPAGGAGAGSGFPAGAAPPGAQGMGGMGAPTTAEGKVGDAGRRERWVGWARWRRMGAHTTAEGKVGGLGAGLARAGGLGKVGEWGRGWKGAAMAEYYNAIANEVAQDGGTYHGGGQGGWAGQGWGDVPRRRAGWVTGRAGQGACVMGRGKEGEMCGLGKGRLSSPPGLPSLPSPCVSLSFAEDKGGRGERGYGGEGMGGHAHAHAAYGGGGGGGGGRGGEGGIGPAARESNIVKMRGLPFSATSKDILEFFGEYPLADAAVHIITNSIGRLTGEAFVEFGSTDEARAAMGKDRERMGTRYIELYLSSRDEATRIATRASTQR